MLKNGGNQGRGSNLLGVGQYNERLILQLIRRAGSLPKAEIARNTGLSAQTVSVIINRLLCSKLLRKQARLQSEGKVGQPSVPIALNPQGAYSIGVKIGRSSLDVLVVDFVGTVIGSASHNYDYPDPGTVFESIDETINRLIGGMNKVQVSRIVGIGVAAPFSLSGWGRLTGVPSEKLERWNGINIRQRVGQTQDFPVWFSNDATAACIAELEFGRQSLWNDFLYIFVGTFIGGGVVQNGVLNTAEQSNAGAIGSMPIPAAYAGDDLGANHTSVQLIHCASRYLLNNQLKGAGFDPETVIQAIGLKGLGQESGDELSDQAIGIFNQWLDKTAEAIAIALVAAISVIDFRGIVIDGLLPQSLINRLVSAVEQSLSSKNMEGLVRPDLKSGSFGNDARAMGAAVLPFYNNFAPDMNVLLKINAAN
jgi:predicted NBD/HSP70 family sugar kinase